MLDDCFSKDRVDALFQREDVAAQISAGRPVSVIGSGEHGVVYALGRDLVIKFIYDYKAAMAEICASKSLSPFLRAAAFPHFIAASLGPPLLQTKAPIYLFLYATQSSLSWGKLKNIIPPHVLSKANAFLVMTRCGSEGCQSQTPLKRGGGTLLAEFHREATKARQDFFFQNGKSGYGDRLIAYLYSLKDYARSGKGEKSRSAETFFDVLIGALNKGSSRDAPNRHVICHNDFHVGNLIVDTQGDAISLVDFERARMGRPEADFDILGINAPAFNIILDEYLQEGAPRAFDPNIARLRAAAYVCCHAFTKGAQPSDDLRSGLKILVPALHARKDFVPVVNAISTMHDCFLK